MKSFFFFTRRRESLATPHASPFRFEKRGSEREEKKNGGEDRLVGLAEFLSGGLENARIRFVHDSAAGGGADRAKLAEDPVDPISSQRFGAHVSRRCPGVHSQAFSPVDVPLQ